MRILFQCTMDTPNWTSSHTVLLKYSSLFLYMYDWNGIKTVPPRQFYINKYTWWKHQIRNDRKKGRTVYKRIMHVYIRFPFKVNPLTPHNISVFFINGYLVQYSHFINNKQIYARNCLAVKRISFVTSKYNRDMSHNNSTIIL